MRGAALIVFVGTLAACGGDDGEDRGSDFEPIIAQGVGQDLVELDGLGDRQAVLDIDAEANTDGHGFIEVYVVNDDLEQIGSVLADLTPVAGRHPVVMNPSGGDPAYLDVRSDGGPWTIEIHPISAIDEWDGAPITGTGATLLRYTGDAGMLEYEVQGENAGFVIQTFAIDGWPDGWLADGSAPMSGTAALPAGDRYLALDTGSVAWTMSVEPV